MGRQSGILTLILVIIALAGFAYFLWRNASPAAPVLAVVPTQSVPTDEANTIQELLRSGLGQNSTPLPTVAIPTQQFLLPTLAVDTNSSTPINAGELAQELFQPDIAQAATPTPPPPTTDAEPEVEIVPISVTQQPAEWRPPPLEPPINRDPLGRDHYWFRRPVNSDANNAVLFNYPFGSDGPDKTNPLRVHHGIDMPNPVGEVVRASGSGVVIWSADGRQSESLIFQNSPSYGNVIVIEHDFAYDGQPLWTLYAHLSASFVVPGQYVQAGDVIGQVGNSGRVTGPHVHFEVRLGENLYRSTINPVLWMVSYVGHGVIAGRVVDARGDFIPDADITIRNWATGLIHDTTTSYVFKDTGFDVNPDPRWRENFAVADVPAGRYNVITVIDGQRITRQVDVLEGMTSFVELAPEEQPTPASVTPEGASGG